MIFEKAKKFASTAGEKVKESAVDAKSSFIPLASFFFPSILTRSQ